MTIGKQANRPQPALRATVLQPSLLNAVSISGLMLTPVAFLAAVLGAWRFSADLGWTSGFFIAGGWLFALPAVVRRGDRRANVRVPSESSDDNSQACGSLAANRSLKERDLARRSRAASGQVLTRPLEVYELP